jgi:hypothetical protein
MRQATVSAKGLAPVCPERLYPLTVFERITGIGKTRRREGRLAGVQLPTVDVGRRKYVEGAAGIEYIRRLSEVL